LRALDGAPVVGALLVALALALALTLAVRRRRTPTPLSPGAAKRAP
jgi:hypothetical protein